MENNKTLEALETINREKKQEVIRKEIERQKQIAKVDNGIDKMLTVAAWFILIFTVISIVVLAIFSGLVSFKELAEGEGMPAGIPLSLQYALALFISTLIALFIVFILATVFFWKPMKEHLEVRRTNIETNIAAAAHSREVAEEKLHKIEMEKREIRAQAKEIISESKQEADRERRKILDKAKDEQNSIVEKSREQIEKEKAQMYDDIRNEIISTSMLAAEKIIEKELDADANKKMVNELLEALK